MLWWERSQGSFAAGAVAVVELRHGGASTRTQLAVGRRTRLGRSRSHGSCRSCEGQTDATGSKVRPQRAQTGVESRDDQQAANSNCESATRADLLLVSPRRPLGHSSSRPQPSSSFLFTLTPLAPAPPPAPAPACMRPVLHLPAKLQPQAKGRSRRLLQLGARWELGAGSWQLQLCWLSPLFKLSAGPTAPSNPSNPVMRAIPAVLYKLLRQHSSSIVCPSNSRPSLTTVHHHLVRKRGFGYWHNGIVHRT